MLTYLQLQVAPAANAAQRQQLAQRFERLAETFALPQATAAAYWAEILEQYEQPERPYHNLVHLVNLLALLDAHQAQVQEPLLVELAIWYHDLVYDAARKDNEALSAQRFVALWADYCSAAQLEQVQTYILATEGHQPQTDHPDERLFLDFDLAILAAEPSVYQQYSQAVEQAYSRVYPLALYRLGRRQVLAQFLAREALFYTPTLQKTWQAAAVHNLQAEVEALEA